jgi:hypothetical protein
LVETGAPSLRLRQSINNQAPFGALFCICRIVHRAYVGIRVASQRKGAALAAPYHCDLGACCDVFASTACVPAVRRYSCRGRSPRPCRCSRRASGAGGSFCRYRPRRSPSRWLARLRRSCRRPPGRRWYRQ